MCVRSLGGEDPLEEGMAAHSDTLACRIPWTEEPGRLQCIGSQSQTRLKRLCTHTVCLGIQYGKPSLLFFEIVLVVRSFAFQYSFRISMSISEKRKGTRVLTGIILSLQIDWGITGILTIIILPIHEQKCLFIYTHLDIFANVLCRF